VLNFNPEINNPKLLSSFILINDNLNVNQLNTLYNIADCYVSPYRAEGFNMPVLEAMSAGCQVIVTNGGATDDFVKEEYEGCFKIESKVISNSNLPNEFKNKFNNDEIHLYPSLEDLIVKMKLAQEYSKTNKTSLITHDIFSWEKVTAKLVSNFIN
jgi:glycosyltransferase involved in cell wall biosynthesis